MTLLYFLYKNGWWLRVDNDTLYLFANEVAKSEPGHRDEVMNTIRKFVRRFSVKRN